MRLCKYVCMGSLLTGQWVQHGSQKSQPDGGTHQCTMCMNDCRRLGAWGWLRLTDHCSVSHCCCSYSISYLHRYNRLTGSPHPAPGTTVGQSLVAACRDGTDGIQQWFINQALKWQWHISRTRGYKDVSCTVPIFTGNEADPFPGIQEWKMTGITGRPRNGSPEMDAL